MELEISRILFIDLASTFFCLCRLWLIEPRFIQSASYSERVIHNLLRERTFTANDISFANGNRRNVPPTCIITNTFSISFCDDNAQNIRHSVSYLRKYNRYQSNVFFCCYWNSLECQSHDRIPPETTIASSSSCSNSINTICCTSRCDWTTELDFFFCNTRVCLTQTCDIKRKSI